MSKVNKVVKGLRFYQFSVHCCIKQIWRTICCYCRCRHRCRCRCRRLRCRYHCVDAVQKIVTTVFGLLRWQKYAYTHTRTYTFSPVRKYACKYYRHAFAIWLLLCLECSRFIRVISRRGICYSMLKFSEWVCHGCMIRKTLAIKHCVVQRYAYDRHFIHLCRTEGNFRINDYELCYTILHMKYIFTLSKKQQPSKTELFSECAIHLARTRICSFCIC